MKITCLSDLHGSFPVLPGGDLLILAGDYTSNDSIPQWCLFFEWLARQNYTKKILIGGNHDNFLTQCIPTAAAKELVGMVSDNFEYLCDSGTNFEGLKIWGTPWSLTFDRLNPSCAAFTGTEEDLKTKYDLIPLDTDIIISHGPAYGILDKTTDGIHVGSISLGHAVERIKPKLFVSGHIHESYGKVRQKNWHYHDTICVNASHVNEKYQPVNEPITLEI